MMSGKKIPLTSAFLTAAVQSCAASIPWQLPALTDSTGKKQHNASQRLRGHWTWRGYRRRERRQNIMQLHMCARNAWERTRSTGRIVARCRAVAKHQPHIKLQQCISMAQFFLLQLLVRDLPEFALILHIIFLARLALPLAWYRWAVQGRVV